MDRVIKFRAWDKEKFRMSKPLPIYSPIIEWEDGDFSMPTDFALVKDRVIWLQFTGLHDKNGREIYEGDLCRVKFRTGEDDKYFTDAYYRVKIDSLDGIHLKYCQLVDNSGAVPDGELYCNQYPISKDLCVRYGTLTDDHRNGNHDRLAVAESWDSNGRQRWKQNTYSNDIEVIGNIYENPDLLND